VMKLRLLTVAGLAVAYVLSARLGLALGPGWTRAWPLWPPAGLAVGAMLLLGLRAWPGVALGAFLDSVTGPVSGQAGWPALVAASAGTALGSTTEAVAGAWLVRRFARGSATLERPSSILRFTALGAVLSTMIGPALCVGSLSLAGLLGGRNPGGLWFSWWLADMASVMVVTPLLLAWGAQPFPLPDRKRLTELAAAQVLLAALCLVVFGGWPASKAGYVLPASLLVPVLLWPALRLGQAGTTLTIFVFWCLVVIGTVRGIDPLAARAWTPSMFPLQAFVGASALMALVLAANVTQLHGRESTLRAAEQRCQCFSELGACLNGAGTVREAAQVIARESERLFAWNAFALHLFSSEHRNAETVCCVKSADGVRTESVPSSSGAPGAAASQVVEEGARLVLREVPFASPPRLLPFEDQARPCASLIYVPVLKEKKAIGVLCVQSHTPRAYSEEDMRVLQAMADHCCGAIERIQAAKGVRRLNAELERRVAERTAQLEAMNKELEAFSYSVSHDLRAPLRSILGFSEVLLERYSPQLDARGQGFLRRACESCQQMDNLIEDLLKLSRVGRSEMRRQPVNLSALAESIAADLRKSEPDRPASFLIASDLCAQGDERLLRVALDNLLRNAWKFTRNKPRACIEFGTVANPQSAFFVRDNGAGFDMARADKLFGVFQRMHSASEFPGSGVGLATVQRIINRHGGFAWAIAAPDQGATFFFTLPQTTLYSNEATQDPDC